MMSCNLRRWTSGRNKNLMRMDVFIESKGTLLTSGVDQHGYKVHFHWASYYY